MPTMWVSELGQHCSTPSHYLNQYGLFVNFTLKNKIQWNSNKNTNTFANRNAFENVVWKMAAILSIGRWVKSHRTWCEVCLILPEISVICNKSQVLYYTYKPTAWTYAELKRPPFKANRVINATHLYSFKMWLSACVSQGTLHTNRGTSLGGLYFIPSLLSVLWASFSGMNVFNTAHYSNNVPSNMMTICHKSDACFSENDGQGVK